MFASGLDIIRGGRLTKWKGRVASYAPVMGLCVALAAGPALTQMAHAQDAPDSDAQEVPDPNDPNKLEVTQESGARTESLAAIQSAATGHATATLTGGTITTDLDSDDGDAVLASVGNALSSAAATAEMYGGTVSTTGDLAARGVHASTYGTGTATATLFDGAITTGGLKSYGVYAETSNEESTATATADMFGGSISTQGSEDAAAPGSGAHGIVASTIGKGDVFASMFDGTINTTGDRADGVRAEVTNTDSTATATAVMVDGTVATQGVRSYGVHSVNTGTGQADASLEDGTVTTGGQDAHGVLATATGTGDANVSMAGGEIKTTGYGADGVRAEVTNADSTATATALMTGGEVSTSGQSSFGVLAIALVEGSLGDVEARLEGGAVTTEGLWAAGIVGAIHNRSSEGSATAAMSGGTLNVVGNTSWAAIMAITDGLGDANATLSGGTVNSSEYGVFANIRNGASQADATALMTDGTLTTDSHAVYAITAGTGDATATLSGGTVKSDRYGVFANIRNGASQADATALMTDGTLTTDSRAVSAFTAGIGNATAALNGGSITTEGLGSYGVFAEIGNEESTATATATMEGGKVSTTGLASVGLRATTVGLGGVTAQLDSGTIRTEGDSSYGTHAGITNVASEAEAKAVMKGGTVTTTGLGSGGLLATTAGLGAATAQLDSGTIRTEGDSSYGIHAGITEAEAEAEAKADMNGGTVSTQGADSYGVHASTRGTGDATATMFDGDITTEGLGSHGVFAEILNDESTATATADMFGGSIRTQGSEDADVPNSAAHGVVAHTYGKGDVFASMFDGTINTTGAGGDGVFAEVRNAQSDATATAFMLDGTVTTQGDSAHGVHAVNAGSGLADASLEGGKVSTKGANAHGIAATATGTGDATASIGGGEIKTTGYGADGILAQVTNADSTATASMAGGTVTTTGARSHGIHVANAGSGGFNIDVSGGTLSAGGDSSDAIHATKAGAGSVKISGEADVTGNVSLGAGDDSFTWSDASKLDGAFFGGAGDDTAHISSTEYDGTQTLNGGNGSDALTFDGITRNVSGADITNWERINIDGGKLTFTSTELMVGSGENEGLFNKGVVSIQNHDIGDEFTINGNYTGEGGTLAIDIDTATGKADKFVIKGGKASGQTVISVMNLTPGPVPSRMNGGGMEILKGDIAESDFSVEVASSTNGLHEFVVDKGANSLVLNTQLSGTGFSYVAVPLALSGLTDLPALDERRLGRITGSDGVWFKLSGDHLKAEVDTEIDGSFTQRTRQLQVGIDFAGDSENGLFVLGLAAHHNALSASTRSGSGNGRLDADGFGANVSATWYGVQDNYVDLQGQINWAQADISTAKDGGLVSDHGVKTMSGSVEVGRSFAGKDGNITPQAQLTIGRVDGGSFTDTLGNAVELGLYEQVTGRIGLAYTPHTDGMADEGMRADHIGNYFKADIVHDFSAKNRIKATGASVEGSVEPTWGEFSIGKSYALKDGRGSLYGAASYRIPLNGKQSNNYGLGGTIGLKMDF